MAPQISSEPTDNIFDLLLACQLDPFEGKIDVAPGIYRDDDGQPFVLPSVKEARKRIVVDDAHHHEYGPMVGVKLFLEGAGPDLAASDGFAWLQTLSGTGACHMAAVWLANNYPFPTHDKHIYCSNPSWFNHYSVFRHAGLTMCDYPYYDSLRIKMDWDGYTKTIEEAPDGSVFCVQACAHNPTGIDPTPEEWRKLAEMFKRKKHFVLFDSAYLGFVSGDVATDRTGIVTFFQDYQIPGAVAIGFGKNFGLYGERVGALLVFCESPAQKEKVQEELVHYTRWENSGCPRFGAEVVATILRDEKLRAQWVKDLHTMSQRMLGARQALHDHLVRLKTPGSWGHILAQKGMFSYTGLTPKQCQALLKERHVYLPDTGRIALTGVNSHNVERLAEHIDAIVRQDGAS